MDSIGSFDYSCFELFGGMQSAPLTALADFFRLEGNAVLIITVCLLAFLCIYKKTRKIGLALVIALIIGALISNVTLKPLVARERPYTALAGDPEFMSWFNAAGALPAQDKSYSFPSGHMTSYTALAAVLLITHLKSDRKAARAVCWVFPVFAFFTGCSRIYLMVHYATDIIGGAAIGVLAGILGYMIAGRIYKSLTRKKTG